MTHFLTVAIFAFLPLTQGNELIVQQGILNARSLAGQVLDRTKAPIANAKVELISCSSFGKPSNSGAVDVLTDRNGDFSFPKQKQKLYCLQLTSPGFDLLQVSIHLYPTTRDLKLTLTPGM